MPMLRVRLRTNDRDVLLAAAVRRGQYLGGYLRDLIQVAAARERQQIHFHIGPDDVHRRHACEPDEALPDLHTAARAGRRRP